MTLFLRALSVSATVFAWSILYFTTVFYAGLGTTALLEESELARMAADMNMTSGQRVFALVLVMIFGVPPLLLGMFLWNAMNRLVSNRRMFRKERSQWSRNVREELIGAWIESGPTRARLDPSVPRDTIGQLDPLDAAAISRLSAELEGSASPAPPPSITDEIPQSHRSHRFWVGAIFLWSIAAYKMVFVIIGSIAIPIFSSRYDFESPVAAGEAQMFAVAYLLRALLFLYLGFVVAFIGTSRRRRAHFEETLASERSRETLDALRRLSARLAATDEAEETKKRLREALIGSLSNDLLPAQEKWLRNHF